MNNLSEWNPGESFPAAFSEVADRVYSNDAYWLGENVTDISKTFTLSNPYFQNASAKSWVLPETARITAFYDPNQRIDNCPVAYFGFWETLNDPLANNQMFATAEAWAREKGVRKIFGPINFNTYGKYRIKLNSIQGEGCFIGEPYNPPYYQSLLEQAGYSLECKYISQILDAPAIQKLSALRLSTERSSPMPFPMQTLTADYWCDHLDGFYALIDSIFNQNFAYSPISKELFHQHYGRSFAQKFSPTSSVFVTDAPENVIGFCIGFPDFAPLCRLGAVKPIPVDSITYEEHFPLLSDPVLLVKTAGVDARYRKHGLLTAMAAKVLTESKDTYDHAIMCLIKDGNYSAEFCKPIASHEREYGLFSKTL